MMKHHVFELVGFLYLIYVRFGKVKQELLYDDISEGRIRSNSDCAKKKWHIVKG